MQKTLEKAGFQLNGKSQQIDSICVYSSDYFNPLDNAIGTVKKTENTHSIHWYYIMWLSKKQKIISRITRVLHKLFGVNCFA